MRRKQLILAVLTLSSLACGGGDSKAPIDPDTDAFTVSDADQAEIDDAAANGEGAEGSYTYDEDARSLTLTITRSSFSCGPQVGTIEAQVESVSATALLLLFDGDSTAVSWTRVNLEGEGVVGIWHTNSPDLYLILAGDGTAQIFGEQEVCNQDRPRNADNCLQAEASTSAITIDGDLSDWSSVDGNATVTDPAGDFDGDDPGADLLAIKVAFSGSTLSVLSEFAVAPSTAFQNSSSPTGGSYRLLVQGYNGLSVEGTLYYSPDSQDWTLQSFSGGVTAEVGDEGIEWGVDIAPYLGQGFESVDFIMVEPRDCSIDSCVSLDAAECVYFDL